MTLTVIAIDIAQNAGNVGNRDVNYLPTATLPLFFSQMNMNRMGYYCRFLIPDISSFYAINAKNDTYS
jgi:hypothetical protein